MSNEETGWRKPATGKQIRRLKLIIVLGAVAAGAVVISGVFRLMWIVPAVVAVIYLYEGYLNITEMLEARKKRKQKGQAARN